MGRVVPLGIKKKTGNPGKRKLPDEVVPPPGMPEPPVYLDKYALEEWYRLSNALYDMGVLSVVDQGAFGACCEAYSDWRHASEELNKMKKELSVLDAMLHETQNGNLIQHALIGIKNVSRDKYMTFCIQFGMTPAARTKMAMTGLRSEGSKFKGLIGSRKDG